MCIRDRRRIDSPSSRLMALSSRSSLQMAGSLRKMCIRDSFSFILSQQHLKCGFYIQLYNASYLVINLSFSSCNFIIVLRNDASSKSVPLCHPGLSIAVSYTHLDVYKRQRQRYYEYKACRSAGLTGNLVPL